MAEGILVCKGANISCWLYQQKLFWTLSLITWVRDWFITSQVPEIAFDIHASAISDVGQVHLVNLIKEIY